MNTRLSKRKSNVITKEVREWLPEQKNKDFNC